MEIIISNKKLIQLSKINNAQNVGSFSYNGKYKYKFISINTYDLVKNILYIDYDNNYYLEQRR